MARPWAPHPPRLGPPHRGQEAAAAEVALAALIASVRPELIVASGDLTHRSRREQHAQAAAFLRGFGLPLLVVPGNHDIPWRFPARLTHPFAEFEREWETTQPVYRSEALVIVGLNSVRAWRHQSGGVRDLAARVGRRRARRGARRRPAHRRAAPPPDRRAVAFPEEACRAAQPRARRARRGRRGAHPRAGTSTRAPSASGASSSCPRAASAASPCRSRRGSDSRGRTGAARRAASTSTTPRALDRRRDVRLARRRLGAHREPALPARQRPARRPGPREGGTRRFPLGRGRREEPYAETRRSADGRNRCTRRDEDRRHDDREHPAEPARDEQADDQHRGDADPDRDQPPHRVGAGVDQAAERADDERRR